MLDRRLIASAALLYLGASLVGLGVVFAGGIFTSKSSGSSSSPYAITLVETMNPWNKSVQQPAFHILGSSGLENSSTIFLPVHRLVQLTIVSYDMPTMYSMAQGGMAQANQDGKVSGTVGGNVYLMNGTIATVGNQTWGHNVTSVPGAALAHTFTLPDLGINIPVVGGSTVVAYLYFDKAGTYVWLCKTPCGFTASPANMGAMVSSGWMAGQVIVQ